MTSSTGWPRLAVRVLAVLVCALVIALGVATLAFARIDPYGGASFSVTYMAYSEKAKAAVPDTWRTEGITAASESPSTHAGHFLMGATSETSDLVVVKDGTAYQVPSPSLQYTVLTTKPSPAKIGQFLRD